jgi:cysteine desulfurase
MAMKKFAVSSGSACTSESLEPSYVLRALGVSEDLAHTSLRIGLGRYTSDEEVEEFLTELENSVARLRELSPLYEMAR